MVACESAEGRNRYNHMAKEPATTAFAGFPKETVKFLCEISENNEKAWFDAHRSEYQSAYVEPALAFIDAIGPRLRKIAPSVNYEPKINGSLFRINRDIRFARDKRPYKDHIDLWFWHGDKRGWDSPGFFFRMLSDRLILGAGMHRFEKAQLERFRAAVLEPKSGKALAKVVAEIRSAGYEVGGATRKAVPRGFDPAHERAEYLLHEGLFATLEGSPGRIVETAQFVDYCAGHFRAMWPISRWLLQEVAKGG
jgi:uncharacterized protein (TIGR02453 family)